MDFNNLSLVNTTIGILIFAGIVYLLFFTKIDVVGKIGIGLAYMAYHRLGHTINDAKSEIIEANRVLIDNILEAIFSNLSTEEEE